MARILFSGVAGVDMRGKLNGSVFSKNRGGAYVRTKVTPLNPQTSAQQNVRNRLATNSQAWRGLGETQRQGWIAAAPNFPYTDIYGNTKILSGQQLYVKLNNNLALLGSPAISVAPSPVAIPAILSLTVVADYTANTVILTVNPNPTPANFYLVVTATPNVGPGKMFVKNLFRVVDELAPATASPIDISAAYIAMFGNPVLGQKIFVKIYFVSSITGQAGIPFQYMTILAA